MNKRIKRGQIYRATLDDTVGSEQSGTRPVIIIQANSFNKTSPTVIVAAITSQAKKRLDLPTHVIVRCYNLPKDSIVLTEQVRTLDKSRLTEYIGRASVNTMKRVDFAIDIIAKEKRKHYKTYK